MSDSQRLFIIGDCHWNTASRAVGAKMAGWEVLWSIPSWTNELPVWRRVLQYRFRDGPDIYKYNRSVVTGAIQAKPNVVWVEDPMFLYVSTLRTIREKIGATLVCAYSDDPRDPAKKSRHFDQAVSTYDVIFTTKDELLQRYFDAGCHCPAKFWKGYDPERIRPVNLTTADLENYQSAVTFIGHVDFVHGHATRLAPLASVARAVPGTKIWGCSWRHVKWPNDLPNIIRPHQIDGLEYSKAICAAKLTIQIPSRLARDTHSSRSVEIPACGTMMLAERTTDHQILFEEDKEAVFFGSVSELVDKAKYYVAYEKEREKIAKAGYERCLRSGYSNYERMKQMLGLVQKVRDRNWIG
ncbi:MAG: glycosyltransferase [Chloroflexi bacterium]|nr:glycosyltransferase [Chloroflexota bacterium]